MDNFCQEAFDWLDGSQLGYDIWERKYRYNNENLEEWFDRVSGGDAHVQRLIKEKKFLFGGRTLTNRGTGQPGSLFNCYSSGYCPDDFDGIMKANSILGLTYKSQGGQGISLSKLRPANSPVGTRYSSDGIIPFMKLFNTTTEITAQAGSRKGALLMSLDIRHKEAEAFIKIKSDTSLINKANLSLEIDDEFMEAVQTYYISGEEVVLHQKYRYSETCTVEYDIIPIKLYKLMIEQAYDYGEPGCLFTEQFRNYNLLQYDDEYQIETANPCGEQPLPKHFACNLGSINLSEFVIDEYTSDSRINYDALADTIYISVLALDKLIDENKDNHAIEEQKINSLNYRNIGLGYMGIATALFKLGITYGSEDAKNFIKALFFFTFETAVRASNNLAICFGTYPKYKRVLFDSDIITGHFLSQEIRKLKPNGLRNCSLLSIAPTGSISTMLGVSGGCEPEFAISYTRKTDNLEESYEVYCKEAQHYLDTHPGEKLPDYFISSSDIYWKDRIDMQAAMQEHVDAAISSTVNLKHDISLEEIEQLYLYAWQQKLKGITIFRDGCKRGGVLITSDNKEQEKDNKIQDTNPTPHAPKRGEIIKVDNQAIGLERHLTTGCGSLHVAAYFDPNTGDLREVYLSKGSQGGCQSNLSAVSRLISIAARGGVSALDIIDQLESCLTCPSYCVRRAKKDDVSIGDCCPSAVAKALLSMYNDIQQGQNVIEQITKTTILLDDKNIINPCPECGQELSMTGGCNTCKSCGYSKCD